MARVYNGAGSGRMRGISSIEGKDSIMRSDKVKKGLERAPHRSLMRATGMSSEDIEKPFIAICNAFNEVIPGHAHLDEAANQVAHVRVAAAASVLQTTDARLTADDRHIATSTFILRRRVRMRRAAGLTITGARC